MSLEPHTVVADRLHRARQRYTGGRRAPVTTLLGEDAGAPLWADRQGWRYALPDGAADAMVLAQARDDGLWFAGDYVAGVGRIHRAIASGEAVGAALAAAWGG